MIREFRGFDGDFIVNVQCKNGQKFNGCDVPSLGFYNEEGGLLSFWFEDKLKTYPMEGIEYFEIVETVPSEEKKL